MSNLWFNVLWPSLRGNGPEALVEIALGLVLGRVVWPRIKAHLDFIKAQNAHLIHYHHPDIPEFDPTTPLPVPSTTGPGHPR